MERISVHGGYVYRIDIDYDLLSNGTTCLYFPLDNLLMLGNELNIQDKERVHKTQK